MYLECSALCTSKVRPNRNNTSIRSIRSIGPGAGCSEVQLCDRGRGVAEAGSGGMVCPGGVTGEGSTPGWFATDRYGRAPRGDGGGCAGLDRLSAQQRRPPPGGGGLAAARVRAPDRGENRKKPRHGIRSRRQRRAATKPPALKPNGHRAPNGAVGADGPRDGRV